jgi:hypothetical protein
MALVDVAAANQTPRLAPSPLFELSATSKTGFIFSEIFLSESAQIRSPIQNRIHL